MVEWSYTKERVNERRSYIFVEWFCANRRNKSVGILNSVQMVVHIASAKNPGARGEHLTIQFLWDTSGLLVTRF